MKVKATIKTLLINFTQSFWLQFFLAFALFHVIPNDMFLQLNPMHTYKLKRFRNYNRQPMQKLCKSQIEHRRTATLSVC